MTSGLHTLPSIRIREPVRRAVDLPRVGGQASGRLSRSRAGVRVGTVALCLLAAAWTGCGGRLERIDAYNDYAITAAQMGLWREATFRWEQAVALDDTDARIWNNLGVAYEATDQLDRAIEAHRRAVELDPGLREYRRNLQRAELSQDRPKAAPPHQKSHPDDPAEGSLDE